MRGNTNAQRPPYTPSASSGSPTSQVKWSRIGDVVQVNIRGLNANQGANQPIASGLPVPKDVVQGSNFNFVVADPSGLYTALMYITFTGALNLNCPQPITIYGSATYLAK